MVKDIRKLIMKALRDLTTVGVATVAGATTTEVPVFKAPCKGRIIRAGFVPKAAITGADTNYMTLGFQNKGSGGTGTGVVGSKAYTLGNNVAAFDYADFTPLANTLLDKDDTVTFYKAITGTGMTMPDLIAVIEFVPDFSLGD